MICWPTYLSVYLSVPSPTTWSPTTAPCWGFYSNPIPNILLGPPRDKAYWGMLVYPYELNGPQLYQDHPAGQGCSVRGYDVAKLTRHTHAHMLSCARFHTRALIWSNLDEWQDTNAVDCLRTPCLILPLNNLQQNFKSAPAPPPRYQLKKHIILAFSPIWFLLCTFFFNFKQESMRK